MQLYEFSLKLIREHSTQSHVFPMQIQQHQNIAEPSLCTTILLPQYSQSHVHLLPMQIQEHRRALSVHDYPAPAISTADSNNKPGVSFSHTIPPLCLNASKLRQCSAKAARWAASRSLYTNSS